MREVQKWAEDKDPIIAVLAPLIANAAYTLDHLFVSKEKNFSFFPEKPVPHLPSWFALYRPSRKYPTAFINSLTQGFPSWMIFKPLLFEIFKRGFLPQQDRTHKPITEEQRVVFEKLRPVLSESITMEVNIHDMSMETAEKIQEFMTQHAAEMDFIYRIELPCRYFFKLTPQTLYRKACDGDVDSLKNLLCLDPLMLHNPAIGEKIQEFRFIGRMGKYQEIIRSAFSPLSPKFTGKTFKNSLGGMITLIAEEVNQPLTEEDIQKLYLAIETDLDIEHDDEKESFSSSTPKGNKKALQRSRREWKKHLNMDR